MDFNQFNCVNFPLDFDVTSILSSEEMWSPSKEFVSGCTPPYDGSEVDEDKSGLDDYDLFADLKNFNAHDVTVLEQSIACDQNHLKAKDAISKPVKKPKSQNAISAKIFRQRKKERMLKLENDLKLANKRVKMLQKNELSLKKMTIELRKEVVYLKNVLSNESQLCKVVNAVSKVPGVSFNNEILHKDHTYIKPLEPDAMDAEEVELKSLESNLTGGICLHVSDGNLSIELCCKCNEQSKLP